MTQPQPPGADSLVGSAAPDPFPTFEGSTDGTDPGAGKLAPPTTEFSFLSPPLAPGELGRLGGYRVLELLGAGGMGLVFRAEDPSLRRPVALKVMRPDLVTRPQAAERFLREARAAAAVKHDHIVTIYQVGQDRGVPFLALEFLKGEPLDARAKRDARLPGSEVRRIGYETALGLAAAHDAGLVHRDIKPANVWLEAPNGRIKILDFGLARASTEDVHLTGSGRVMGTPAYMSPEQANGQPVDARTDLFSLGAMLYRLATGRLPFEGDSAMAILAAMATTTPVPPERYAPDLPPDVADVIKRLLARNPDQRIQSARQVADQLTPVTQSVTIVTAPMAESAYSPEFDFGPTGETTEEVPAKAEVAPPPRPPRPARRDRGPWLVRSLFALCGLVFLFGAVRLGAYVVEVKTARGTLVIESEDPNVEVIVKKDGAVIKDKTGDREIELKVGDYTIELAEKKDGLRLMTNQFTIERNGKTIVRVRLDKPAPDPKPDPKPPGTGKPDLVTLPPLPGASSLDALDPAAIPAADRRPWFPKEMVAPIGSDRQRHWGGILRVVYSPDGKLIATTGNDFTVRLWDAETLDEKAVIPTYPKYADQSRAYFSPDGARLVVWRNEKNGTSLYDVRQTPPRFLYALPTSNAVSTPFFPDGKHLLLQTNNLANAQIWDVSGDDPKLVKPLDGFNHGVWSRYPLPNDRVVTVAPGQAKPEDNVAVLWDVSGDKPMECDRLPLDAPEFAVSPDGKWLALAGTDTAKRVRLFDLSGDKFREEGTFDIASPNRANSLAFVPGTDKLIFSTYAGFWGIRARTTGATRILRGDSMYGGTGVYAAAPGGKQIAFQSAAIRSLLLTFDVAADGSLAPRNPPDLAANGRPSGDAAWAVTTFPTVTRWHLGGKQPTPQAVPGAKCWNGAAATVLSGGRVVSRKHAGPVAVFDPARGDGAEPDVLPAVGTDLHAVEASPGGRWLALSRNSAAARSPVLIDLKKVPPAVHATLAEHPANSPGGAMRFEFTRDDGFLLSWNPWDTHLWDLRGPKPRHLDAPKEAGPPPLLGTTATLAVDQPTVVVGYATGHVRLFAFTGSGMASGPRMQPFDRPIAGAVMLPGERTLLACDDTGRIRFVDVSSGKDVLPPWKFPGPVHLRLAPDGRHVFAEAPAGGPLYVLRLKEANPPLDPAWATKVAGMTGDEQAEAVKAELKRRNPGLDPADVKTRMAEGRVTHLMMSIEHVTDLTPLRALPDLTYLFLRYASLDNTAMFNWLPLRPLRDLAPLQGLKLKSFQMEASSVDDLSPLAGMPLESLMICNCRNVRDLSPLKGMPLTYLHVGTIRGVTDLTPLVEAPLEKLDLTHGGVTDLRPLAKTPLKHLRLSFVPDRAIVGGIETLETINYKPVDEFWKEQEPKKP